MKKVVCYVQCHKDDFYSLKCSMGVMIRIERKVSDMRFLLLRELFLMKRKLTEKKDCWHTLTHIIREEEYRKYCRLLEEAQIDYRIWMSTDAPMVVRLRRLFENPERYRMQYDFFVRRRDFKRALRVLKIDKDSQPINRFFDVIT